MRYSPLLLFFLLLISIDALAQNQSGREKYVDSLLREAESLPHQQTFEALQLGLKAYNEAKDANLPHQMAQSLVIAGKKEAESKNYYVGLKHANEAINIAKTLNDPRLLSDAYRVKGLVLSGTKKYEESKSEFQKALFFARTIKDEELKRSRLGVIYNDLAYNFDEAGNHQDSVVKYYKKGWEEFDKMNLQQPLRDKTKSLAFYNIGATYLKFHELDSAKIVLGQARQIAQQVEHHSVEANSLEALANLYRLEKEYQKSIDLYLQAIDIAKKVDDLSLLKKLYFNVSLSYDAADDLANSKKYLNEYLILADSIEEDGSESEGFFAKNLEVLKSREGFARKAVFFVLFCVGFVALVFYFFREKKIQAVAVPAEKTSVQPSLEDQQRILRSTVQLAERDDPSFLLVFKKSFPQFFEALDQLNPGLIAAEHKMCALLVLNFSTKEIAQFTNSSVRAIEAKKYRLRKKLNVPSEVDINLWMIDMFKRNT